LTLNDELTQYAKKTFAEVWTRRAGQKVPDTADVTLGNMGVDLDAVVLYADLAESTALVKGRSAEFAAEIYKTYLYCAAKIIIANGGTITAYDGDRVMAVFIGNAKNSAAGKTALKINGAVQKILKPAIKAHYPHETYDLRHKVGIDASTIMASRTGVRGNNDLVWVGTAANNAAKLAARGTAYSSYITSAVHGKLNKESKYGGSPEREMWTDLGIDQQLGVRVYGSTWHWSV
jgi:class 3 adenylate cyclase